MICVGPSVANTQWYLSARCHRVRSALVLSAIPFENPSKRVLRVERESMVILPARTLVTLMYGMTKFCEELCTFSGKD